MYCSKCNMNISDDSIFCYRCGTKVIDMDFDEPDNSVTKNTCSNCGNEISDDAIFCYKCGNKTSSEYNNKPKFIRKICDNCGSKINKDDAFCYKCGTSTGNVNSNETTNYKTENNNSQINDVSKVKNVSNQSTEVQSYNSANVNTQSKGIKLRRKHPFLWMCGIAMFLLFIEMITAGNGGTSSTNTNNKTTTKTTYNGIKLPNTYTNEAEGISFNYPDIWKDLSDTVIFDGNNGYNDIICLGGPTDGTVNSAMYVDKVNSAMYVAKLDTNSNSIDTAYIRTKVEDYMSTDIEIQEIIDININGVDAIKLICAPVNDLSLITYYYIQNGDIYVIFLASESDIFDTYEPIFDAIMESYKITTPTESTAQNQNTDDYGLSEEEALAAAQKFAETHPLYDRTITGYVLYEPQFDNISTKGLYMVQTIAPDGSPRVIWVDKRTGSLFMMPEGEDKLLDAETAYEKMFVNN